jgi:heavy metal sensor kinase
MRLSIRWRLTFWNTLALALVLVGFAGLVYGLSARALYQQTDQRLHAALERLQNDARLGEDLDGRLRYWAFELHEHENIFCVIYDGNSSVRERTPELATDSVPAAPAVAAAVAAAAARLDTHEVPIIGRQRTLQISTRLAGENLTVLLMTPLADVDRELARLAAVLGLAIPAALGLAGVLGYWLARKALVPVEELRRSTHDITAERLYNRLPVTNPSDELGGLAITINQMIERLERSFAEVRRFTADASHELRTPLTVIRSEAEAALTKNPAPEQQHLLGSILEECDRLTRLTDQLLMLSRDDAGVGKQIRGSLDLVALVSGVVENMRPLAEAKGLTLNGRFNVSLPAAGDTARLRQVFYNLLDNAIKYTPSGGRVEVSAERQGASAVVTIRDTGEGIAAEHLPHIFERFYRVDQSRSRSQGGTGLGLSIARSIVSAHGGTIQVASAPGEGARFTVVLPLNHAAEINQN